MEEIEQSKMSACLSWDEIDLAESYLVSGLFVEAAELATSILTRLRDNQNKYTDDEILLDEMMESSAMVLAQSWRESGRTSDLMNELESYFGSVTEIPVQVVLTSACVQVSGGNPTRVRDFLENYLAKWHFSDEKYFVLSSPEPKNDLVVYSKNTTLEVDQYLKVVEFYALKLMGRVLNDVDNAVSWVEKAQLPEEERQDLLRRLSSLYPCESSSSTHVAVPISTDEEPESHPLTLKEVKQSDKSNKNLSNQHLSGVADTKQHSFWTWLQTMAQRSCTSVVASKGKIFVGCLIFLIWYFVQKRRATIKRAVQRRLLSLKQTLVDFWKLAFSYQVNPLAAVQPLPASANRSR